MTSLVPDSPDGAATLWHSAFYKFVVLDDPDALVLQLRALTQALLGSVLVAEEGLNGVLEHPGSEVRLHVHPDRCDQINAGWFGMERG